MAFVKTLRRRCLTGLTIAVVMPVMANNAPKPLQAARMPPAEFADDIVAWAMWLYYAEGRTQNDVAETLGVSRASVANYLGEARRRGLVSVQIAPDLLATVRLGRQLSERFGLAGTHVIPSARGSEVEVRRRLGVAAAQVLSPHLSAATVLGVAWGRTMLALAQALPERSMPGLRVVQVSGSSLSDELSSPEFCTALIANRLGARCENLHAPAVLSSPDMRDALVSEPGIARQLARVRACDLVALGVGELDGSVMFTDGQFLTAAVIEDYIARGAVGVVLGRFIDAVGGEVEGALSGRQIGMELAELRATPERICVAGGPEKVAPIRAMLAGGYLTQLVTDAPTARALVEGA